MNLDTKEIILILVTTFLFAMLITPFIKRIAFHIKSVDKPNERRINKVPMPTLGGLVIFLTFILGYILFSGKITDMIPIILGGIIIFITGMIDDINPIKPKYKFLGQLVAALIITVYGGLVIQYVDAFGIYIDFGIFKHLITILFIVGMINAVNFIDGLDGLAAGICEIFFITITIIALVQQKYTGLDIYLTLIMAGTTAGFLVHNFYPAKIYLGDSGAMFLGYIVAVIGILGFKVVTLTSFVVPIFIMAIPIFDTACAIIRRLRNKQSISTADKKHLHHRLLDLNISHKNTVLIIYLVNSLFAVGSVIYALVDQKIGIIFYLVLLSISIYFVIRISYKNKNKPSKRTPK